MNIHVRIMHKKKEISMTDALKNGLITVLDNGIQAGSDTVMSLSSMMFDCNGNELFENDIVKSINGNQYKIIYDYGMFFLSSTQDNSITPLYIYKIGHCIDVEKVII